MPAINVAGEHGAGKAWPEGTYEGEGVEGAEKGAIVEGGLTAGNMVHGLPVVNIGIDGEGLMGVI